MKKTNKLILSLVLVFCIVLVLFLIVKPKQSPQSNDLSYRHYRDDWDNDEIMAQHWFEAYGKSQTSFFSLNKRLNDFYFEIEILDNTDDALYKRVAVKITMDGDFDMSSIFQSEGIADGSKYYLDIVVHFTKSDKRFSYVGDQSRLAYDDFYNEEQLSQGDGPIDHLINTDSAMLKVRRSTNDNWVVTPIQSDAFSMDHQGWKTRDKRFYYEEDTIVIVFKDHGMSVAMSIDNGITWKSEQVISESTGLGNYGYVHLDVSDQKLHLVAKHYVAMNSYIATFSEAKVKTFEWVSGPIIDKNSHISEVSVINDRIFYTQKDDDKLYFTDDLGASEHIVTLPIPKVVEGPAKELGLSSNETYIQASVPFKIDNKIYMYVGQGIDRDIWSQSVVRFISSDVGQSWKFDSHLTLGKYE